MGSSHFLPRRKRCRWQADKSKLNFGSYRKTPCLLRVEKRVAGGAEGSVGGPDEIKRRDRGQTATKHSSYLEDEQRDVLARVPLSLGRLGTRMSAIEGIVL